MRCAGLCRAVPGLALLAAAGLSVFVYRAGRALPRLYCDTMPPIKYYLSRVILPDAAVYEHLASPCEVIAGRSWDIHCNCTDRFRGKTCQLMKVCDTQPCLYGSTCYYDKLIEDYSCQCVDGTTGRQCDIDVDECVSNPCQNGGTCFDRFNLYTCACIAGYKGGDCNVDLDECASDPCQHHGLCKDHIARYSCVCYGGYTGAGCEEPPACPKHNDTAPDADWVSEVWRLRDSRHAMYRYPEVLHVHIHLPYMAVVARELTQSPLQRQSISASIYRVRTTGVSTLLRRIDQLTHSVVKMSSSEYYDEMYFIQSTTLCVAHLASLTHQCFALNLTQDVKNNMWVDTHVQLEIDVMYALRENILLCERRHRVIFILNRLDLNVTNVLYVQHRVEFIDMYVSGEGPPRYVVALSHNQEFGFLFFLEDGRPDPSVQLRPVHYLPGDHVLHIACGYVLLAGWNDYQRVLAVTKHVPKTLEDQWGHEIVLPHGMGDRTPHGETLLRVKLQKKPPFALNGAPEIISGGPRTVYLATNTGIVLVFRDIFRANSPQNKKHRLEELYEWRDYIHINNSRLSVQTPGNGTAEAVTSTFRQCNSTAGAFLGDLRPVWTYLHFPLGVAEYKDNICLLLGTSDGALVEIYRNMGRVNVLDLRVRARRMYHLAASQRLLFVETDSWLEESGQRKEVTRYWQPGDPAGLCVERASVLSTDTHGLTPREWHTVRQRRYTADCVRDLDIVVRRDDVLVIEAHRKYIDIVKIQMRVSEAPQFQSSRQNFAIDHNVRKQLRTDAHVTYLLSCRGETAWHTRVYVYTRDMSRAYISVGWVTEQGGVARQRTVYNLPLPHGVLHTVCQHPSGFLLAEYVRGWKYNLNMESNKRESALFIRRVFHNGTSVMLKRLYSASDVTVVQIIHCHVVVMTLRRLYVILWVPTGQHCRVGGIAHRVPACAVCDRGWTGRYCESALTP